MTETTLVEMQTGDAAVVASLQSLPFVRDPSPQEVATGRTCRVFWDAQPSGNWQADCAQGAEWARALLNYMEEHRASYVLGWVVADMRQEPELSGQAVGFLGVFATMARLAFMLAAGKVDALCAEAREVTAQTGKGGAA